MANLYSPGIYFGRKSVRTVYKPGGEFVFDPNSQGAPITFVYRDYVKGAMELPLIAYHELDGDVWSVVDSSESNNEGVIVGSSPEEGEGLVPGPGSSIRISEGTGITNELDGPIPAKHFSSLVFKADSDVISSSQHLLVVGSVTNRLEFILNPDNTITLDIYVNDIFSEQAWQSNVLDLTKPITIGYIKHFSVAFVTVNGVSSQQLSIDGSTPDNIIQIGHKDSQAGSFFKGYVDEFVFGAFESSPAIDRNASIISLGIHAQGKLLYTKTRDVSITTTQPNILYSNINTDVDITTAQPNILYSNTTADVNIQATGPAI